MQLILIDDDGDEIGEYDLSEIYDVFKRPQELLQEIKEDVRLFGKNPPKEARKSSKTAAKHTPKPAKKTKKGKVAASTSAAN